MKSRLLRRLLIVAPLLNGCADFRNPAAGLKPFKDDYRITGLIENADDFKVPVRVGIIEWDRADHRVDSGDRLRNRTMTSTLSHRPRGPSGGPVTS